MFTLFSFLSAVLLTKKNIEAGNSNLCPPGSISGIEAVSGGIKVRSSISIASKTPSARIVCSDHHTAKQEGNGPIDWCVAYGFKDELLEENTSKFLNCVSLIHILTCMFWS